MTIELIADGDAARLLDDADFIAKWHWLYRQCPWRTGFQSAEFVATWYRIYSGSFRPLLVVQRDSKGELLGVAPIAVSADNGRLLAAGGRQAEYVGWLARKEHGERFIEQALDELQNHFPGRTLEFKYLPPGTPTGWATCGHSWKTRAIVRKTVRPLIPMEESAEVTLSLKKKHSRSRLNRLRRLGELRFKVVDDPAEFATVLDQIIAQYDCRQGAEYDKTPFRSDGCKRSFYLALMRHPDLLHVSITTLDEHIVASHIGIRDATTVYNGISSYSLMHAKNSPGILHFYSLVGELAERGFRDFDLTPGGDAYKERFAKKHEPVHTITVFFSRRQANRQRLRNACASTGSKVLKSLRLEPSVLANSVRRFYAGPSRNGPKPAIGGVLKWAYDRREFAVYRTSASSMDRNVGPPAQIMAENNVAHLLDYEPTGRAQTKASFLKLAGNRFATGSRAFSYVEKGRLLQLAWLGELKHEGTLKDIAEGCRFPAASAVMYDFYTHPDAKGQELYQSCLQHMVRAVLEDPDVEHLFVVVSGDDARSCEAVRNAGFEYYQSTFRKRILGRTTTWQSGKDNVDAAS